MHHAGQTRNRFRAHELLLFDEGHRALVCLASIRSREMGVIKVMKGVRNPFLVAGVQRSCASYRVLISRDAPASDIESPVSVARIIQTGGTPRLIQLSLKYMF